jgi:hypothetical protein
MKYDSLYVGFNEAVGSGISIYPNPFTNILNVNMKNCNSDVKFIEIYELRGKKVFESQTIKDKIILNIDNYPCGLYFIKVTTDTTYFLEKVIKN